MVKISPFSALRYNKDKVSFKDVVCPPYDVINTAQRKEYIKLSPYNVVRLVLPEHKDGSRDCKQAKKDLLAWMKKGVLKQDAIPSIYVYSQECKIGDKYIKRIGFLSLLKLESGKGNSGVLPHENVFSKPLFDRVKLMKKTKAHLSPIFIVFKDKKASVSKALAEIIRKNKPELDIYADNARHKLWVVTDIVLIDKLVKQVNKAQTFIADGHHRFKASTIVKDHFDSFGVKNMSNNGHSYTLSYLVSSEDKGLEILPTYRAVKEFPKNFSVEYMRDRLAEYFHIAVISAARSRKELDAAFKKKACAFAIYYKKKYFLITLKDKARVQDIGPKGSSRTWKELDVSILHNLVFDLLGIKEKIGKDGNIYYYKDMSELIKHIDSGAQKLGVLLNPSTMDDVIKLAVNGEKMPHKSTYFYPKPLTGLVIHKF